MLAAALRRPWRGVAGIVARLVAAKTESAPAQADYTAELEKLAKLKGEGILTDDEYAAKKKQILGI